MYRSIRWCLTAVMCLGIMVSAENGPAFGQEPGKGQAEASFPDVADATALGDSLSVVLHLLREKSIGLDVEAAKAAIEDALIKSADPHAVIISSDEAAAFPGASAALSESRDADVHVEMLASGAVYVKLGGLFKETGTEVMRRLIEHSSNDVSSCILDLREAGGEDLDSVCELASLFLTGEQSLFVVSDCLDGKPKLFKTVRTGAAGHMTPVVVLTGSNTSGASELLAGVLKGSPGVLVAGSSTRGDARLRELVPLDSKRHVYIGTRLLVPVGHGSYDGRGVKPDIEVDPDCGSSDATESGEVEESSVILKNDLLLRRASDIVQGLKALGSDVVSVHREGPNEEETGH